MLYLLIVFGHLCDYMSQQNSRILEEKVLEKGLGLGSVTMVIQPALLAGHLKTSMKLDCLPVKYFI